MQWPIVTEDQSAMPAQTNIDLRRFLFPANYASFGETAVFIGPQRELSSNETRYPRRFNIMIVDEAHNAAPMGRGKYATDSLRTLAIRSLSPHFEHKLFLTATPHNDYKESLTALLEVLDDQRFARGWAD
jgi:hypothetical protein